MRLIKKYKNRRLYDTHSSRYVTIDELNDYILKGVDFEVRDSVTNRDITNATLLQLLLETQSGTTAFLSPTMLRQLIKMANHPMSQTMGVMLEQMLKNFEMYR